MVKHMRIKTFLVLIVDIVSYFPREQIGGCYIPQYQVEYLV